jgi:hypothetical protein
VPHGTTHIVLEPLDLIARLAVLVPAPRVYRVDGAMRIVCLIASIHRKDARPWAASWRRSLCTSYGARRMTESAVLLA